MYKTYLNIFTHLLYEVRLCLPGFSPHSIEYQVASLLVLKLLELVPGLLQDALQHVQLGTTVTRAVGAWKYQRRHAVGIFKSQHTDTLTENDAVNKTT